jgi:hypothetical protein
VLEGKVAAYLPKDRGSHTFLVDPIDQLSIRLVSDAEGQPVYEHGGPGLTNPNTLRPYRYRREGHRFHWEVGPKTIFDEQELLAELTRIANDPGLRQPDKDHPGQTRRMPVVIEPQAGTFVDDAARTADACRRAGFTEINFGGGRGRRSGK